jgi:diguanylate cyclase (GGDEF)-like protein/PAS domain S-box-containing protein
MGGAEGGAPQDRAESRLDVIEQTIRLMPIAAFITDAGQRHGTPAILFANDTFLGVTGYSFEELDGQSPRMIERDGDDEELIAEVMDAFTSGRALQRTTVHRRRDGALYHLSWTMSPICDVRGQRTHYLWLQRDVTDQVEAEQLRDTLAAALHMSSDSVMITNDDERVVFVNRGFLNMSGMSEAEIIGKHRDELEITLLDSRTLAPVAFSDLPAVLPDAMRSLASAKGHDGATIYLDIASTSIVDPSTGGRATVHIAKDVTDSVLQRTTAHEQAHRDVLTGLLNRRAAETRLATVLEESIAGGEPFAVIMLDIDHFKSINDPYGHAVGDDVLHAFGTVLSGSVRASDAAIRWGGEEFLIVLPGASLTVAASFAERLRIDVERMSVAPVGSVTVSSGVAEWSGDESTTSLVSRADVALYSAKHAGRNRVELAVGGRSSQPRNHV